jgi:hypothetical protein
MSKIIAPAAINALKEALTYIYWYKSDLKAFLIQALDGNSMLGQVNWDAYKRDIVTAVVDTLARNQNRHQATLLNLMLEVSRIDDFSHLSRLDDGEAKAKRAGEAVAALRKVIKPYSDLAEDERAAQKRREQVRSDSVKMQGVSRALEELRKEYYELFTSDNPQQRGYKLEHIIKTLFDIFDLDPKASFRIVGEQIDGAFTFDNTDYLFEGKWQQSPVDVADLDGFSGKISRRLDNTLGLFLSINSFSPDAIAAHCKGKLLIILMDGADLMAVLEERISLPQLLLRKRRHAAQTGEIYLKAYDILKGG